MLTIHPGMCPRSSSRGFENPPGCKVCHARRPPFCQRASIRVCFHQTNNFLESAVPETNGRMLGTYVQRLKTLFWTAVFNFVFPIIFNIVLIILVVLAIRLLGGAA